MAAILFGSAEAQLQLEVDKARPGWMMDVPGYGSPAPLPTVDAWGGCIPAIEDATVELLEELGDAREREIVRLALKPSKRDVPGRAPAHTGG